MTDYEKIQRAADKANELWKALHDISAGAIDFNEILNSHGIEDDWIDDIFKNDYHKEWKKSDGDYLMKLRMFIVDLEGKLRGCKKPLPELSERQKRINAIKAELEELERLEEINNEQ